MSEPPTDPGATVDVLVVGAGPTGLALAAQLERFGASFRIVDRSLDRAHESRALAVQARTLELFDTLDLAAPLVDRGNTSMRVAFHLGAREVAVIDLGTARATDTRFPFILFVSQAETEELLGVHLIRSGVQIERGVELVELAMDEDGAYCVLGHGGARRETVRARYVVGCDGAHSTVRNAADFSFEGASYPQDFVLGDVEADGPLEPNAINPFVGGGGVAMFFPLGRPATWRVIAMARSRGSGERSDSQLPFTSELSLAQLQEIVNAPTQSSVRVRDPAWLARFHLHHRQAAHYRDGRVFLAGDAAHIHSPVGAQGMNTGIQDAWNLGWKLALVARGTARPEVLDTYETERWPVGRFLLRYTDRIFATFTRAMSAGKAATWARELVVPRVIPRVMSASWLRSAAFRFASELGIRYRASPLSEEGSPRLTGGPRAGDRLPDARLTMDGAAVWLQRATVGPQLTLLLCGDPSAWQRSRLDRMGALFAGLVVTRHLSTLPAGGRLFDPDGATLHVLGATDGAQYVVRPDGYIGFRCAGYDLTALEAYLRRWLDRRPMHEMPT
jgi:2-polyprenyl-6-methoxyphenol hydroxylase-like FAD-dependent oxidoreductase